MIPSLTIVALIFSDTGHRLLRHACASGLSLSMRLAGSLPVTGMSNRYACTQCADYIFSYSNVLCCFDALRSYAHRNHSQTRRIFMLSLYFYSVSRKGILIIWCRGIEIFIAGDRLLIVHVRASRAHKMMEFRCTRVLGGHLKEVLAEGNLGRGKREAK